MAIPLLVGTALSALAAGGGTAAYMGSKHKRSS